MEKRQKELIIAPIVVILAILSVISTVRKVMRRRHPRHRPVKEVELKWSPPEVETGQISVKETVAFSKVAKDSLGEQEMKTQIEKVTDDTPWGRDPFTLEKALLYQSPTRLSRISKLEQFSRLKLNGVVISKEAPKDSIAIINGENLKLGETILGFAIKDIKPNSVLLGWDEEEFLLTLWEEKPGS